MNKRKKTSNQQQFMKTMMITGVLGLSIMVAVMLYMIKLYGPKKPDIVPEPLTPMIESDAKEAQEGESLRGVIHHFDNKRKKIQVWDIEDKEHIILQIKDKSLVRDSYGKPMSIQEIQLGEIVDVTYEAKKGDILVIQKSAKAWTKTDVSGASINIDTQTIKIGNIKYNYTSDTLVANDESKIIDLSDIDPIDTLVIKGIDEMVWSVNVTQSAGYLKLTNIPTIKGTIEIGNNKIYRLEEIVGEIALASGEHKIVIRMEGYQPFVKHVKISAGQVEEINLGQIEEAIASLRVRVINTDAPYTVKLDHQAYEKDEPITVKPGQYTLKVIAEEFKTFTRDITLEEGNRRINISLEALEKEPVETEEEPVKTETDSPDKEKIDTSKPKPNEEKPTQEIKTVQIMIETDPSEAQVFLDGIYKGMTPALTGLKPGEYSITIEKEGYSSLYSTIIIDASNAQKGFLYTLQKEE